MTSPITLPQLMRAWQWDSCPSTLSVAIKLNTAAPLPAIPSSLKPDQILVRVHYVSLNAIDYKAPEVAGRFLRIFTAGIPGSDYCGTVVAAGSGRSDLRSGQLVFGMRPVPKFGSLADYVVGSGEACIALPDGISARNGATIGVAAITAYQCIKKIDQKEGGGGKIFINGGSGGVGTYAIQLAKARGYYVVTTCSSRNAELCKSLGADDVIDYTRSSVVDALIKHAREEGEFNLAIDLVGSTPLYWQAHQYLNPSAPFVSIAGELNFTAVMDSLKVSFWPKFLGGGRRNFQQVYAAANARDYSEILELMRQGKVKPVIERVYDMEEAPSAFERLHSGRVAGKLVVKVGGE